MGKPFLIIQLRPEDDTADNEFEAFLRHGELNENEVERLRIERTGLPEIDLSRYTAIIVGGLLMIWLADRVSDFLQKNRMYEVLGLFVLFVVGIMLLLEGAHLAHMKLWGNEISQMSKTTFYFVIVVLVLTDLVQSRYQKKLLAEKNRLLKAAEADKLPS